jgi:hypothetical protein
MLLAIAGFAIAVNGCREAAKVNGTYYPGLLVYLLPAAGLGLMGWGSKGSDLLRHAKAPKKVRVIADELKIYQDMDSRSAVVARLPFGTEVEIGGVKEVDGVDWVIINLADGQQGYIVDNAPIFTFLKATVVGREAILYQDMDFEHQVARLATGDEIEVSKFDLDSFNPNGPNNPWLRVWLPEGQLGYINRKTRIKLK